MTLTSKHPGRLRRDIFNSHSASRIIVMNNDSVTEQSGIYAGDGGFDITVGGHTQLDGAVIASTGSADK